MNNQPGNNEILGLHHVEIQKAPNARPLRDYSPLWDLPFPVENLALVLSHNDGKGWPMLGLASDTEGRSFHLERAVFRFKGGRFSDVQQITHIKIPPELDRGNKTLDPVIVNDLQLKGGGVPEDKKPDAVKNQEKKSGKPINYFSRQDLGRTDPGPPAGAFYDYNQKLDEGFGWLFHAWGGRTRMPVVVYPLEYLNFPEGTLSVDEARKAGYLGQEDKPVVSAWGMRCRFRIDDFVTLFGSSHEKSTSKASDMYLGNLNPSVENFSFKSVPDEANLQKALVFAGELTTRMKTDNDFRWKKLAEKYPSVDQTNLSDFYLDYLTILSRSMGEQMGILYKNDVVLYMLNFQNFSCLAEIFDFDVATFKGKTFIDGTELTRAEMKDNEMLTEGEEKTNRDPDSARLQAQTCFSAIKQITELFSILRHPGIINCSADEFKIRYDKAIGQFGKGFIQTGFPEGLDISEVPRNIRFIGYLEDIISNDHLWTDLPNPITESFTGVNRLKYGFYSDRLKRRRKWLINPDTVKNFKLD